MRKITAKIGKAFLNDKYKSIGNSMTNGSYLYLHNNEIMRKDNKGNISFSLANWGTPTTRERINGVLELLGSDMRVRQKDYNQYVPINGKFKHWITCNEWVDVN